MIFKEIISKLFKQPYTLLKIKSIKVFNTSLYILSEKKTLFKYFSKPNLVLNWSFALKRFVLSFILFLLKTKN